MANSRQALKSYKGYNITKINGYKYFATIPGKQILSAYSLDRIKKLINNVEDHHI